MLVKPRYRVGGILWWKNQYGQQFAGRIVRLHERFVIVKRDEWFAEEAIDPDRDVVQSRYFSPKECKENAERRAAIYGAEVGK
jgi:hypothetical protein